MNNIDYKDVFEKEMPRYELTKEADDRIERTLGMLGVQDEPVKKRKRGIVISGAMAALCTAFLIGINIISPSFAEAMPLIGDIYKAINNTSKMPSGENIGTYPVKEINVSATADNDSDSSLRVINGLSDGARLHLSVELKINDDALKGKELEDYLCATGEVTANGKTLKIDALTPVGNMKFLPKDNNIYVSALSCILPEELENGTVLDINLKVSGFALPGRYNDLNEYIDDEYLNPGISFNIDSSLTVDTGNNQNLEFYTEDNGFKVFGVDSKPSQTVFDVEVPAWGKDKFDMALGEPILFLEDGSAMREATSMLYEYENEFDHFRKSTQRCNIYFDGLPNGTKKVVLRMYKDYLLSEVLAEVTVDIENGKSYPSISYKDGGPLDIQDPAKYYMAEWRYTKDNVLNLSKKSDGLFLTDMYTYKRDGSASVKIETSDDYREIRVELYRGSELISTGYSKDEGYSGTNYEIPANVFIRPQKELEKELEKDPDFKEKNPDIYYEYENGVNYYMIALPLEENSLSRNDTQLTVKVYDNSSNELLYEKTMEDIQYSLDIYEY